MTAFDNTKQTLSPIITKATALKENIEEKVVALRTNTITSNISKLKGATSIMAKERGKIEDAVIWEKPDKNSKGFGQASTPLYKIRQRN